MNDRQQGVHRTSGSLRVFRRFVWLKAGSVKMEVSRPTQPPLTQDVGRYNQDNQLAGQTKSPPAIHSPFLAVNNENTHPS
jgi:hypothetical protein